MSLGYLSLLSLLLASCDVYDAELLRVSLGPKPGGSHASPVDGGTDAAYSLDDAGDDASTAEPECIALESPSCPLLCKERCNGEDDDCDGLIDETGFSSLCDLHAATAVCVVGRCLIASCDRGHVDCNDSPEDGCEATLDSVDHCGLCSHRCELSNAEAACSRGSCDVASCKPGFGDCDAKPDNGCERPLNMLTDCGACGTPCRLPHATTSCDRGACAFTACAAGWGDCNEDADKVSGGDGCETDLNAPDHCGRCGVKCSAATPYCSGGKCTAITCPADRADCDGNNVECETDLRTTDNCGGCGLSCGSVANATVSCSGTGTCEPTCKPGFASCDDSFNNGCETDIHTLSDCGACGVSCSRMNATSGCGDGSCQLLACNSGYGDCNGVSADGCEQRLNTSTQCGQCGRGCALTNATASCSSGSCQVSSCNAGYGNCDGNASNGCESSLTTDAQHCGACGQACPANFICQGGRCVCDSNNDCASGQSCCDGDCVDIRTDTANCGSCGAVCASGESCCSGTCKNLSNDFNNCGSCGHSCGSNSNWCNNGQCRCTNDSPCSGLFQCCANGCHTFLFCQ